MRTLAPASSSRVRESEDQGPSSSSRQRKPPRAMVSHACVPCRRRKSRCNGENPCSQCIKKGTECEYVGRLRQSDMRKNLQDKNQKLDECLHLIAALRTRTSTEARHLLQGLRDSGNVDKFISEIHTEDVGRDDPVKHDREEMLPLGWSPLHATAATSARREAERIRRASWHPALQINPDSNQTSTHHSAFLPYPSSSGFQEEFQPYQNMVPAGDRAPFEPSHQTGISYRVDNMAYNSNPTNDLFDLFNGCALENSERTRHKISTPQSHSELILPRMYPANGYVQVFGNLPMSSAVMAGGYPDEVRDRQLANFRLPDYLIQPLSEFEDCPIGRAWIDYRDQARLWLANNPATAEEILGSDDIKIDLAFRDRQNTDPENVVNWACDYVKSLNFHEMGLLSQLAWISLLSRFMKWILDPTPKSYAQVPNIMKPTLAQRLIPHSPALDPLAFPCLRDHLIIDFKDYLSILLGRCFMDWPFGLEEAVNIDPNTNERTLTSEFEQYVAQLSNWSVTSDCLDYFPTLKDFVQVRPS